MSSEEGAAPAPEVEKTNGVSEGATPGPAPEAAKPKYRHDWYQTEADVCINVLIKKLKRESVHVDLEEKLVKEWTETV